MINPSELLFVVDENNNPITPLPRDQVHRDGIWHRNAHVWILNSKNELLCQQRSLKKDTAPGKWESFFGGHLAPKQEYLDCALSELNEELGIKVEEKDLKQLFIFKNENAKEFQAIHLLNWDGEISSLIPEKDEVEDLKWISIEDIKTEVSDDNWSTGGYEDQIFTFI